MECSLKRNTQNHIAFRSDPKMKVASTRAAFLSKFILLRENKKSKAHREIEKEFWGPEETAQDLYAKFLCIFEKYKDNKAKEDLKASLKYAKTLIDYFVNQYSTRITLNFGDALRDYKRTHDLLEENCLKPMGWKIPRNKSKFLYIPRKPAKIFGQKAEN